MIRETVHIELKKEYKEMVFELVDSTINKVAETHNEKITEANKRTIKNLCFDQVNIHVSSRAKSKTIWIFDTEECIPIIVERETTQPELNAKTGKKKGTGSFVMKPNLTWTYNSCNNKKGGMSKKKFEERVLEMLAEDFETAAFYGTLSYITEGERNVGRN